ncbi:hypothetical protein BDZ89DRAFT_133442 [Hymenopellis radicata]|nr:hypothetical protein BDZ89DRAFT_133442 [Hymenopellis radicata]
MRLLNARTRNPIVRFYLLKIHLLTLDRMMRGCTEHYVLTVETSIVSGGQFIPPARMKASVVGLIHTMLLDYVVTNITHLSFWALYARISMYWSNNIQKCDGMNDVINLHVPDHREPEGLSNIVALGNLMLFGTAILLPNEKADVLVEIETAKDFYLEFVESHSTRYAVHSDQPPEPYFYREALHFIRSLLHFAVIVSRFRVDVRNREVDLDKIVGTLQSDWTSRITFGEAPDWDELLVEAQRRANNMEEERDAFFFAPLPSDIVEL